MPKKFRHKDQDSDRGSPGGGGAGAINWTMCVLCVSSLAISGLLAFRELRLEERIAKLESTCQLHQQQHQQQQAAAGEQPVSDVLIERLKRELKMELDEAQKRIDGPAGIFRLKRDVAECNCPPGKFFFNVMCNSIYRAVTIDC